MVTKSVELEHKLKDNRERAYAVATKGENTKSPIKFSEQSTPKEKSLKSEIENLGFLGLPLPKEYQNFAFSLGCYNAGKRRAIIIREEAGRDWYLQGKLLEEHSLHEDLDFINGYNRAMSLSLENRKRGR